MKDKAATLGSVLVCTAFAVLCAWTMQDMLSRTFLRGLLAEPVIPVAVWLTAVLGFLVQHKWIVMDDPAPTQYRLPDLKSKPKKVDLNK